MGARHHGHDLAALVARRTTARNARRTRSALARGNARCRGGRDAFPRDARRCRSSARSRRIRRALSLRRADEERRRSRRTSTRRALRGPRNRRRTARSRSHTDAVARNRSARLTRGADDRCGRTRRGNRRHAGMAHVVSRRDRKRFADRHMDSRALGIPIFNRRRIAVGSRGNGARGTRLPRRRTRMVRFRPPTGTHDRGRYGSRAVAVVGGLTRTDYVPRNARRPLVGIRGCLGRFRRR